MNPGEVGEEAMAMDPEEAEEETMERGAPGGSAAGSADDGGEEPAPVEEGGAGVEDADLEAEPEEPEETYEYTEQQVRDIRAAFSVFDEVLNDTVPISRLGSVLRSLGLNPTEAELRAAAKWLDADPIRGVVRFKEFLIILGRALKDSVTEEKVLEGFRGMDAQRTGMVSRAVLHDVLTTAGERLYPLEFAAFIKYADPKRKGVVKYEDFVRKMNSGKLGKKKKKKKRKKKKKKKKKKTKAGRAEDSSSSGSSCGELSV